MTPSGLVLLTRPDCALCEEFQQEFAHWAAKNPTPPLQLQDIDTDPLLQRRYGLQIPVLLWQGARVCATRFDADELARMLKIRGNR